MTKFSKKFNRNRKNALRVSSIDLFSYHLYQFGSLGKALSRTADRIDSLYDVAYDNKDMLDDISALQESMRFTIARLLDRTSTIITALLCISIAQAAMLFILLFV